MRTVRRKALRRSVAFAVLAFIAVAVAALAATTGQTSTAGGKMTPAIGANDTYHVIDQVNGSAKGGPTSQPGRLRQCQLDGTCYGPNQIRNAYGFQSLLDRGIPTTRSGGRVRPPSM